MEELTHNINSTVKNYIESQLTQIGEDHQQYYQSQAEIWKVNKQSLEQQLDEKNSHISLLEERLATLQEELSNLKKVSYIQMITKQLDEKDNELKMYRHRFEKSQKLVSDMKQSNDFLNQQVEKAHLEKTKEPVSDGGITTPASIEVVEDKESYKDTGMSHPATEPVKSPETGKTDKVEKSNTDTEAGKPKTKTAKSQNTLVWDGQTYEVKERKIKSKQYLVVTKALDGEERWIFPMDGSSPVGKVTNGRKCTFF